MPSKNPDIEARDWARSEEFLKRLSSYRRGHPETERRGWMAEVAKKAGINPGTLSRILAKKAPALSDKILAISDAIGDASLLPPELRGAAVPLATTRIGFDRGGRSDLPASVADRLVPRDLVEYLSKRGQEDGVKVHELIEILESAYLEERDRARSPDFYSGLLTAIRGANASSRAR